MRKVSIRPRLSDSGRSSHAALLSLRLALARQVCMKNRKVFLMEQVRYTNIELQQHIVSVRRGPVPLRHRDEKLTDAFVARGVPEF